MLLKGKDIKMVPLRRKEKEGVPSLFKYNKDRNWGKESKERKERKEKRKEILFKINDVLYFYNRKDMTINRMIEALEKLKPLGTELREIEIEIESAGDPDSDTSYYLTELRDICRSLQYYIKRFSWANVMPDDIEKNVKYEIYRLVRAKEDGTIFGTPLFYLDEIQEVKRNIIDPFLERYQYSSSSYGDLGKLNEALDKLFLFNNEILDMLDERYRVEWI